jgi:hypothetical protein
MSTLSYFVEGDEYVLPKYDHEVNYRFRGSLALAREQDPLRLPASSGGASGVDEFLFEAFDFFDSCEDRQRAGKGRFNKS